MSDLTPETLAEWREDAHDPKTGIDARTLELKRRILALLDALAKSEVLHAMQMRRAEKAEADAQRWMRREWEQQQRAHRAEAEAEQLADYANYYLASLNRAEEKYLKLLSAVQAFADKGWILVRWTSDDGSTCEQRSLSRALTDLAEEVMKDIQE